MLSGQEPLQNLLGRASHADLAPRISVRRPTMIHKRYDFLQAVGFLDQYLPSADGLTPIDSRRQSPKQGHSIRDS